jgi:hypothetical protein
MQIKTILLIFSSINIKILSIFTSLTNFNLISLFPRMAIGCLAIVLSSQQHLIGGGWNSYRRQRQVEACLIPHTITLVVYFACCMSYEYRPLGEELVLFAVARANFLIAVQDQRGIFNPQKKPSGSDDGPSEAIKI